MIGNQGIGSDRILNHDRSHNALMAHNVATTTLQTATTAPANMPVLFGDYFKSIH